MVVADVVNGFGTVLRVPTGAGMVLVLGNEPGMRVAETRECWDGLGRLGGE